MSTTFFCRIPDRTGEITIESVKDIEVITLEIVDEIIDFSMFFEAAEEIRVPEGIREIAATAFSPFKGKNLRRIIIPHSMQKIYSGAFNGCENLEVFLKNSKIDICWQAFPKGTKIIHVVE